MQMNNFLNTFPQRRVASPTLCVKEEIVQQVSHTEIVFECYFHVWKVIIMPSVKRRMSANMHLDILVAYRDCGLSYCSITTRIGIDSMTVAGTHGFKRALQYAVQDLSGHR